MAGTSRASRRGAGGGGGAADLLRTNAAAGYNGSRQFDGELRRFPL